jgi:hypothetical protein
MRSALLVLGLGFAASSLGLGGLGCSSGNEAHEDAQDDLTNIPVTTVEDQAQNDTCWLYATTAWLESLHAEAAGTSVHYSPAYLEYWRFYNLLTAQKLTATSQVRQTGYWGWASNIIQQRGIVPLGTFSDSDAVTEYSAFTRINAELKAGAFGAIGTIPGGALVRAKLDAAFGLSMSESALLTEVFGSDGSKSFLGGAVASGTVVAPQDFAVLTPVFGQGKVMTTLDQVMGTWAGGTHTADDRSGAMAWTGVYPPGYAGFEAFMGEGGTTAATNMDGAPAGKTSATTNTLPAIPTVDPAAWRPMLQRIQRALNDGAPLPAIWEESRANADATGAFHTVPSALPSSTGSHVTLLTDYQVSNVPGFGTLLAGTPATPAQMAASLDDGALVDFLRAKNSWATDIFPEAPLPGYVDLDLAYLMEAVYLCNTAEGSLSTPSSTFCTAYGPMLWDVILPPGY